MMKLSAASALVAAAATAAVIGLGAPAFATTTAVARGDHVACHCGSSEEGTGELVIRGHLGELRELIGEEAGRPRITEGLDDILDALLRAI